jgi:hypothetical protein
VIKISVEIGDWEIRQKDDFRVGKMPPKPSESNKNINIK